MKKILTRSVIIGIMKFSMIPAFLLSFVLCSYANDANGQDLLLKKISLKIKSENIKNVLTEIEKVSEAKFMYSPELIQSSRKVSITAKKEEVSGILNRLLLPLGIRYEVVNNYIILSRNKEVVSLLMPGINLLFNEKAVLKVIKGRVITRDGQPLQGVSVTVKGGQAGTSTDVNGNFSLTVDESATILIFSYIGYTSSEVSIVNRETLSIVLQAEIKELDDVVVVVGYGTQKKKDLTGAVSTIGSKDVGGRQTIKISEALQGSISGVSVTRGSGGPGAGSSILIRGITTIGDNTPLIVVDGVQIDNIDNVNPNDVDNITVLKDAASAAIYGSRGAAGVILVTTKRAKDGQSSLEYNYEYGVQRPTALPEYASAPEYMRYFNEKATNDGASAGPYSQAFITNFADSNRLNPDQFPFSNTDWQKDIMTNKYAPRQRNNLVFTIGTGKLKTKASLDYSKTGAFYDNYTYERYLFRINNDLQINKKMSVNLDISFKRTNTISPVVNPIYEARLMPSIYDDYYSDGHYALAKEGRNPIAQLNEGGTNNGIFNNFTSRLAFNYELISGLTLTALVSPSFEYDKSKNFSKKISFTNPDGSQSNFSNQARTNLSEGRSENLFITGQFLANYTKAITGGHNLGILAGYEELFNSFESLGASRSGFALTGFPYLNSGSQELRDNSGSATESALRSFFGRAQYNFKNKYYVQGNIRYDKSSRFAAKYRGALFPSVSAGWILTEESFLQRANWLSFLKLRGSYGVVGNERIGDYPYQATISFTNALFYQNGVVTSQIGGAQFDYAVENISWETTRTQDIGLDAAFLKNRLTLTADYYKKRTSDILLNLDIPLYLGYNRPSQNAGILDVKGWELEIGWKDRIGKLNYSAAFNLSDAKSTIVDLKGTILNASGPQSGFKGSEYNEWFGYQSNGLYQTAADAAGSPRLNSNVTAGDVRYADMNKDGKITPEDKVLLGGSLPRYLYGGNIRMDYMGFDFGLVFQGVGKQISRLSDEIVRPFGEQFGNVPLEMVGKFWSKNNTAEQNLQATYPRLSTSSISNNYTMSDYWLTNGAYFRIKNITLGYTLKSVFFKKAGMQSFRLYLSANDIFSIHHFPKYWDPEVGTSSYPIVRTFMAGATVRF